MSKFSPKLRFTLLAGSLCLCALSGCSGTSAKNTNDPSQDLSRMKSGPSPEDIKAMERATKGIVSGAPKEAQNTANAPK